MSKSRDEEGPGIANQEVVDVEVSDDSLTISSTINTDESLLELSSSDIFFLNDLMPFAISPIRVGILPFPNNKRTIILN